MFVLVFRSSVLPIGLFQEMQGLTPEVAEVAKQVIAGLIQCNPSPAVIEFFEEVVKGIDAVTLASRPENEPSTTVIEEIEAPEPRRGPSGAGAEATGSTPLRRPHSLPEKRRSSETRAPQTVQGVDAGAALGPSGGSP